MTEQDAAESGNATDEEPSGETDPAENGSTAANEPADGSATAGEDADSGSDEPEPTGDPPLAGITDPEFDGAVAEELLDHVAESDTETVAEELAALRERVSDLETNVEDLEAELADRESDVEDLASQLKRKQADFQNYKKRMKQRREEEKQRATEDLVERLLDVRDNLGRALDQEASSAEDLRDGVETTVREFDRVLEEENVEVVEPEPGDEVDPERHEVLMRVDADQPGDAIADVHRPGYVMAGKVLRTAQVTVSEGGDGGDGAGESEETGPDESTDEAA